MDGVTLARLNCPLCHTCHTCTNDSCTTQPGGRGHRTGLVQGMGWLVRLVGWPERFICRTAHYQTSRGGRGRGSRRGAIVSRGRSLVAWPPMALNLPQKLAADVGGRERMVCKGCWLVLDTIHKYNLKHSNIYSLYALKPLSSI